MWSCACFTVAPPATRKPSTSMHHWMNARVSSSSSSFFAMSCHFLDSGSRFYSSGFAPCTGIDARPLAEGVREGALFLVTQQEGDIDQAQVALGQISARQLIAGAV